MAKNKKMCKVVAFLAVLAMMAALVPTVAFAAEVAISEAKVVDEAAADPEITVTGSLDAGDITLLAYHSTEELSAIPATLVENEIMYVDQKTVDSNKEASWTFKLRNGVNKGYIMIFMGGTDVANYKTAAVELLAAAPALAFDDANTYKAGDDVVITFTDDADWRGAVTAVKVGDTAVDDANYALAAGTLTISNLAVGTYNKVEVEATGYSKATLEQAITISLKSAGTVALAQNDKDYYVNGAQVLDLSQADAGWLADVTMTVKDENDNDVAGAVVNNDGTITLDPAPNTKTAYKVSFSASADYAPVDDISFNIISADGAKLAEAAAPAWGNNDNDADAWTVTVPADTADITYSAKLDNVDIDIPTNRVISVDRPDDDSNPDTTLKKVLVITATVNGSTLAKDFPAFEINEKGVAAAAVKAENVEILGDNAYGEAGKTLVSVTIDASVVDPATASMTVGDAKLYYSPVRNMFFGVVASDKATDAETLAANIVIDKATASENLYFGVTVDKDGKTAQAAQDFSNALKKYLKKPVTLNDKQNIAMDVAAVKLDAKFNAQDFSALLKLYLKKATTLPVNNE